MTEIVIKAGIVLVAVWLVLFVAEVWLASRGRSIWDDFEDEQPVADATEAPARMSGWRSNVLAIGLLAFLVPVLAVGIVLLLPPSVAATWVIRRRSRC